MELFKNKYRIPSARLQSWDYASAGMYFITICTRDRECYFGNIINEEMHKSEIGRIAESEWIKTLELRPDMNLEMGEFIVMPNHFHAIVIIGENAHNQILHSNKFEVQSKNLAALIRGYKSAITSFANDNNIEFAWQSRFHDHIIRSMDEYYRISDYILNNVRNWMADKFFKS